MVIVKLYTLYLFVFSGLLNSNCAMVEFQNKQYAVHVRTVRQTSRPILNGIIFLLATNLIAKGVLGLNTYSTPATQNLQGSLYLNFGRPTQQPPNQAQAFLPYTQDAAVYPYAYWNPVHNSIPYSSSFTTPKPQPIHQHQIINIHESPFEGSSEDAQFQEYNGRPNQHIVIEKQGNTDIEPIIFQNPKRETNKKISNKESPDQKDNKQFIVIKREAEQKEGKMKILKVKPALELFKLQPQQYFLINKLAHFKRQVSKVSDKDKNKKLKTESSTNIESDDVESFDTTISNDPVTFARQMVTTTAQPLTTRVSASTSAATVASSTSGSTTRAATTTTPPMTTMNITIGNESGYDYGYGNYTGNDNVSITTISSVNGTGNVTTGNITYEYPGYYYHSDGDYGPSNGNENISITYGPPAYYDQNQPFYSSPTDHYLDNHRRSEYDNQHYNNNNFNNYYQNDHNQYQNPIQQFNEAIQRFYNKYDYHYPGYSNSYLVK